MTYTVEKLPDRQIIIFHYDGIVRIEDALGVFKDTEAFKNEVGEERVYRVSDFTNAESTFTEIMKMLQAATQQAGGTADPNVTVVFVGSTAWARLYKDAMAQQQRGGKQIPMLTTVQEALDFIEVRRQENAS